MPQDMSRTELITLTIFLMLINTVDNTSIYHTARVISLKVIPFLCHFLQQLSQQVLFILPPKYYSYLSLWYFLAVASTKTIIFHLIYYIY